MVDCRTNAKGPNELLNMSELNLWIPLRFLKSENINSFGRVETFPKPMWKAFWHHDRAASEISTEIFMSSMEKLPVPQKQNRLHFSNRKSNKSYQITNFTENTKNIHFPTWPILKRCCIVNTNVCKACILFTLWCHYNLQMGKLLHLFTCWNIKSMFYAWMWVYIWWKGHRQATIPPPGTQNKQWHGSHLNTAFWNDWQAAAGHS